MHSYPVPLSLPNTDQACRDIVVLDEDFDQFDFDAFDIEEEKEDSYEL